MHHELMLKYSEGSKGTTRGEGDSWCRVPNIVSSVSTKQFFFEIKNKWCGNRCWYTKLYIDFYYATTNLDYMKFVVAGQTWTTWKEGRWSHWHSLPFFFCSDSCPAFPLKPKGLILWSFINVSLADGPRLHQSSCQMGLARQIILIANACASLP